MSKIPIREYALSSLRLVSRFLPALALRPAKLYREYLTSFCRVCRRSVYSVGSVVFHSGAFQCLPPTAAK
jgi:hypothetical protein